jgi:hypothetical protein
VTLLPAQTPPPKSGVVKCPDHGEQLWQGDLRCSHCGQVYPAGEGLTPVPDVCGCKSRLLPPDRRNSGAKWSARMACPVCVLMMKVT